MNAVLTLYPLVLLLCILYRAKLFRNRISPEFLSLEQSKMIRGAACVGIILHHLAQQSTGYGIYFRGPVSVFNDMGFLFTGLFFFFSGYGLIQSVLTKQGYLESFLKKRLPAVLIPFWAANLFGVILKMLLYGNHSSAGEKLCYIFGFRLINSNGWFIVEIVVLYLLFWILFCVIRNRDIALWLLCAGTVLLIVFCYFQGHDETGGTHWFKGEWWYNATAAFAAGVLYARFQGRIRPFCVKYYRIVLTAAAALSSLAFAASVYMVRRYGYYNLSASCCGISGQLLTLLSQTAACIAFVILILLLNMHVMIGNRVLRYLGAISTECFLFHGYFVHDVFRNIRMNDFLRYAAVIGASLLCASLVSPAIRFMVRRATGFLSRKRIINETLERKLAEEKKRARRRILKKAGGCCIALSAAALLFLTVGRSIRDRAEYREECERLREAEIGDVVLWGRFETDIAHPGKERLSWILAGRENGRICLLSENGIAGSWYHQKHEPVSWRDSDLRALLNSKPFTDAFSKYEKESMVPSEDDLLTLLTEKEALELFASDEERELKITSAAELSGTNTNRMSKDNNWDLKGYRTSWWWLRGENGRKDVTAPIVTVDGEVVSGVKAVNKPGGALRPVIWVRLP